MSVGLILGFLGGGIKTLVRRRAYSREEVQKTRRLLNWGAAVLKYTTFALLLLGLVWCVYFLILGITAPQQADYANSMSELIVAVLTVISILFAFVEFIRRK